MRNLTVLILAGGKGTRMKSKMAKVLHRVGGLPMLECVVRSARQISDKISVVVGHQASAVEALLGGVRFIQQDKQLGTGHAVMLARESLETADGDLMVLPGDVPLIQPSTLRSFAEFHRAAGWGGSVLTARVEDPNGYGRIIRRSGHEVDRIVEHHDADADVLAIREINSGIYMFDSTLLFSALEKTRTDNAQEEYYLTDVVGVLSVAPNRFGAFGLDDPSEGDGNQLAKGIG